jgi:hypothetical protein
LEEEGGNLAASLVYRPAFVEVQDMPHQLDQNIELYLEVHEEDSTAVLVVEGGDGLAAHQVGEGELLGQEGSLHHY